MLKDSPPHPQDIDLDSSAARIRNWQIFYGAVETTSTSDGQPSPQSERDYNSNSRDKKTVKMMEPAGPPIKCTNEFSLESIPSVSANASTFYYAYPDVADHIEEAGCNVPELRGQMPWSYIQPAGDNKLKGRRKSQEHVVDLEERDNMRHVRLRSDSSVSGG